MAIESPKEKWTQLIEEWRRSGMSGAAWCHERQLSYSAFGYWKKRLLGTAAFAKPSAFIEIKENPPASAGISLVIGGTTINISRNFDPLALRHCLQLLRSL